MSTSTRLVGFAVLITGALGAWFLLGDRASEVADPLADGPVPRAADATARPADRVRPSADTAAPAADPAVEPPAVEAPAADARPGSEDAVYLRPEQLRLEHVQWDDVPARDVLLDIGRRARLRMVIPAPLERTLEDARVRLDLENTTGAIVISRVLVPLGLTYTVRGDQVYIFVDDA